MNKYNKLGMSNKDISDVTLLKSGDNLRQPCDRQRLNYLFKIVCNIYSKLKAIDYILDIIVKVCLYSTFSPLHSHINTNMVWRNMKDNFNFSFIQWS